MEQIKKHSETLNKPDQEILSIFCVDSLEINDVTILDFHVIQLVQSKYWENNTRLSDKARKDLILVLQKDIGVDRAREFSDEDLNKVGLLLLTILAENLKLRVARPDLFEVK